MDRFLTAAVAGVDPDTLLTRTKRTADHPDSPIDAGKADALLKTGALQKAIFNSANFSSIATDANGVIQIFNVGAERMLGYAAADVVNKITPADISDPLEVITRAKALSLELGTPIAPGFEALVFKASRGIEDIYELTYFGRDGSRFPPELRSIPVVILSIVADANKGFSLGAAAVMQKPISRLELYEALVGLSLFPRPRGKKLRVLIADDDPNAVELIALQVTAIAGTVIRSYGGREAIDMARRELPDVIVLDLMMPDVNGFDVVAVLNERPETASIPVLVVTSKHITAEDRAKLTRYVATIMEKAGFDSDFFTSEIRRAMAGRRQVA